MMYDTRKLNYQHMLIKKETRKRLKIQKNVHRLNVGAQRNKLQLMLLKQKENACTQIKMKQSVIIPLIKDIQKGLKTKKKKRRIMELNARKNLFFYSTIPSEKFSDNIQYSLRYPTITSSKFSELMKSYYGYTLVPDLNFTDLFVFSHKSFSRDLVGAPSVCRKRKEMYNNKLAITPTRQISEHRTVLKNSIRINKQVK
jgi:hypothetical protein